MGFHICTVVYVFGIPELLFWEAPPNDQVLFVLNQPNTAPRKAVNAAASKASSLRLSLTITLSALDTLLIITLAENSSFKRDDLTVS